MNKLISIRDLIVNKKYIVYVEYNSTKERLILWLDLPNEKGRYYTIVIDNYSENDYEVLRDELTLFN